jgi:glycosyltransferase involved in cell wall biosynthesis
VVLYYHNITPPEYVQVVHPRLARGLALGREQLHYFKQRPYALAGSAYNRRELLALGYSCVDVLPYFILYDSLQQGSTSEEGRAIIRRYGDGKTNWLFVGRLVPNKCQGDLVRAFAYYQRLVDPASRLLLVGSSADTPGYRGELERLIRQMQVSGVELCDRVSQGALGAYYHIATAYVSMSEHEGFGVPLVEAMHLDVPVVAYAAAAVPDTLGPAGILFHHKRFEVIAELLRLVAQDAPLRARMIERQRKRVADFASDRVAEQLRCVIERVQRLQTHKMQETL